MSEPALRSSGGTTSTVGGRTVVTVTFEFTGRRGDYAVDPSRMDPRVGDFVVLESRRGLAMGRVVRGAHAPGTKSGGRIRKVIRIARPADLEKQRAIEERIPEFFRIALQEMRAEGVRLKLVAAAPDAFARRVTFYMVGEDRPDSEALERTLARRLDLGVDIKQLGRRDETKAVGGLGRCGQELCCSTFLPEYPPTSIRHAKEQGMALASDRTSGVCGKTLCCLSYEADLYKERRKFLPKTGKRATTTDGKEGKVIGVDVMRGTFTLLDLDRGRRQVLPAEAWDKNVDREVPPPEFPRTLAEPKTGGLRDRIGDPSSLPAARLSAPESNDAASTEERGKQPKRRRQGRRRRPKGPHEDS